MQDTASVPKKPSWLIRIICALQYLLLWVIYVEYLCYEIADIIRENFHVTMGLSYLLFGVALPIFLAILIKKHRSTFWNFHTRTALFIVAINELCTYEIPYLLWDIAGIWLWYRDNLFLFYVFRAIYFIGVGFALAGKQPHWFRIFSSSNSKRCSFGKAKSSQGEMSQNPTAYAQTKQTLSARDIINEQMKQK